MIVVPAGVVGLDFANDMQDPIHGNRNQWFTYDLLDNGEAPKGSLPGVTGGTLEWHANAAVKGGGKIKVISQTREDIPWLRRRVKITMHIEGKGSYPLGIFIPSAPVEQWSDTELTLEVELLDKCSILDNDYFQNAYSLDAGTNVTAAVRELIEDAGEKAGSITDGDDTLSKAMNWESGTSRLQIINDLLEAANYFSLRVDGDGRFRVEKYRLPRNRPIVHEFIDNYKSIYASEFTYEKDIYSIPNRVVLIAQGDGAQEGMKAVAENTNPDSPYSYPSRGRWIVDVVKGVEATDQQALDERAQKRLVELTSPTGTVSINHAPLPWLGTSEAVRFKRDEADIDIRAVVASTQIDLDPMALQRTALQEVAEL
jgi:hypothetical protein